MHDVARVVKIMGGSPIMAETQEDLEDIIPDCKAILLNMGTPTSDRFNLAKTTCQLAEDESIPIVLDPVGCNQTRFRLRENINLLESKAIVCLKANLSEAISLLKETVDVSGTGTESIISTQDPVAVAKRLVKKYGSHKKHFFVVITGSTDVICTKDLCYEIKGERNFASRLVGTGCILGGILADQIGTAYSIQASEEKEEIETEEMETEEKETKEKETKEKASKNMLLKSILGSLAWMKSIAEQITSSLKGCYMDGHFHETWMNQMCLQRPKIYAITDEAFEFETELMPRLSWMLEEGIDYVQYRNKTADRLTSTMEGERIKLLCNRYNTPIIVNDSIELAYHINADGVHLGNEDSSVLEARRILGMNAIIGATVKTREQGIRALENGADYVGIGAIYPSNTKKNAIPVTQGLIEELSSLIPIEKFGIGGINLERIVPWMMKSLNGIALVNTLFSQSNEEMMKTTIRGIKLKMLYEKGFDRYTDRS